MSEPSPMELAEENPSLCDEDPSEPKLLYSLLMVIGSCMRYFLDRDSVLLIDPCTERVGSAFCSLQFIPVRQFLSIFLLSYYSVLLEIRDAELQAMYSPRMSQTDTVYDHTFGILPIVDSFQCGSNPSA